MQLRVPANISFRIFCLLLFWSICSPVFSVQINEYQIKTGYISNFFKYLSWENENNIDTFKIGIYGDDIDFISVLKGLENIKSKSKPIQLSIFKSFNEIKQTHLLIITNDKSTEIKSIFGLLKDQNTLIVTDRCESARFVMINFIYTDKNKIQFEINSQNLTESKIGISPKIILLGGSEIDVRKLYQETEKSLISEKGKVESYEQELSEKRTETQLMNTKLDLLYKSIGSLQNKISLQKIELSSINQQKINQKGDLDQKSIILQTQQYEIANREKQLNTKNKEIANKQNEILNFSRILNSQKKEIDNRQAIIDSQERALNTQVERIQKQQIFLYLLITLIVVLFLLVFIIYYFLYMNKRKNLELEKLSIVARETDNAIMIANEHYDFEWVNEGFNRFYGYNLDQYRALKGNNLVQASSYPYILEVLNSIMTEKKSLTYELSTYNKDGRKIWVNSTLTPILDANRNIKKLIIIDSDITHQKESELAIIEKNEQIQHQAEELYKQTEQLTILNRELEIKKNKLEEALVRIKNTQSQLVDSEKMVILGQLTAGIAHEINNPINFINSGIEGIKMSFEQIILLLNMYEHINESNISQLLPEIDAYKNTIEYNVLLPEIDQLTKDVKAGIYRTIEIVKGLRTFSRLDESDLKFINLHENIESTLIILRNKYSNRISIIKNFHDIPEIECYPGKINQVLLNIIINAIQAIPEEGQIEICTSPIIKNDLQYVEIKIKDNGLGMTDEVRKKIFDPFYTTKETGDGTGLGLSISYSIIENHHGTINVESVPDKGSNFIISLPVNFISKNGYQAVSD